MYDTSRFLHRNDCSAMTMKVVGGRNLPPYWGRFDRLQRTAHKLGGTAGHPRGVFRFSSFEEFDTWKKDLAQNRHALRHGRTSSRSAGH